MVEITPADVESRWRKLSSDELPRAQALIADAMDIVSGAIVGDVHDGTVRRVVCSMVIRAMSAEASGPMGLTHASWTASPYGGSSTFSGPSGELYLSKQERLSLGGLRGRIGSAPLAGGAS